MISEVSDELISSILATVPAKSLGKSENIVHTVSFLLDERADYLTGQSININGGVL